MMAKLGDIATYINGYPFKPTDWSNEGLPIIRIQDLTGNSYQTNRYNGNIDQKYEVNFGDVLISWSASLGVYVWKGEKAVLNQHIFKVIFDQELVDKNFFVHQVECILNNAVGDAHGATMKHLTKPVFDALPFYLPDFEEQKRMAAELDAVSNLISLRKQQLSKLDELVKSRFIELFVGRASNPEPLKSFLEDITYGFTNPMPDAEEGPWKVTAKDVVDGKVNFNTARKTTVQAFDELTAKSKPTVGDVLLTKDGTLGRCAVVEEDGICVNQSVAVLKCNEKILPKFLAILLQMPEYQREMLKNAGGGTIKHIYITKVVDMLIVVPSISQQREFLSFVQQTDKSKLTIQQSLEKLETLKKALMQKYFG